MNISTSLFVSSLGTDSENKPVASLGLNAESFSPWSPRPSVTSPITEKSACLGPARTAFLRLKMMREQKMDWDPQDYVNLALSSCPTARTGLLTVPIVARLALTGLSRGWLFCNSNVEASRLHANTAKK